MAGGVVDAVIACAGLSLPKAITANVNYFGMTEFIDAMQPALAKSEAPRVALISSLSSIQSLSPDLVAAMLSGDEAKADAIATELEQDPAKGVLIYPSSKRAISQWIRRESITPKWAGTGIPMNAVAPGIVVTPMTKDLLASPEGKALADASVPMPLNYHQRPESIANLLIWLTSEEITHCCGQTIYADGGADAVFRGDDIWSWFDPTMDKITAEIYAGLQACK